MAVLAVCASAARGQYAPANPEWNRPIEPFRIVGNLYYVGVAGVSSFLFTTLEGHILLDGAFRESVPLIEANIGKLGFRMAEVRLLLNSHAHYDHAGGLAGLKAHTGARLLSSPADAALLARGGKGDFAFGDSLFFPPVEADALLQDGQQVRLGGTVLTAHFTPGHTKGCTTWTATVKDGGRDYRVVIPCSVTAPGYRLVDNAAYPGILNDYEATFAKLRALPCDIFLASHSWDFGLKDKAGRKAPDAFVNPDEYRRYIDKGQASIRAQAEKQKPR